MKQRLGISIIFCLSLAAITALAQQKKAKTDDGPPKTDTIVKGAPIRMAQVVLGRSTLSGGGLPKRVFDSLMKQGIKPVEHNLVIKGFELDYMERNWTEDSVGNFTPIIELSSEYCNGDTLSRNLKTFLYDHTKKGDTVFVDNIKITWPDGVRGRGNSMKFWIQ